MNTALETPSFFGLHAGNIHSLRARIQHNPIESGLPQELLSNLNSMLGWMSELAASFDKNCTLNIGWIGSDFQSVLRMLNEGVDKEKLQDKYLSLFTMSYRFLGEFSFNHPGDQAGGFARIQEYISNNMHLFPAHHKEQLVYASYFMPAQMTKQYLDEFKALEVGEVRLSYKKWVETLDSWNKNLDEREARVNALQVNLEKQRSAYNFLGLVHGFEELKHNKLKEKRSSFKSLRRFAWAILVVPTLQFSLMLLLMMRNMTVDWHTLSLLPAVLALELILIYFFRISLGQYKSVKAQILQLDLRISLCKFIEDYTDHIGKLKEGNKNALQKFESLIFSGLMTDGEKIPSVLDGVEQLANLIRSVQGKSSS